MMSTTISLTTPLFLKKIEDYRRDFAQWKYLGDKPAVIEFYTPTCPHCQRMRPIVEFLAEKYKDLIYIYLVNIEEEIELSSEFDIDGTPTFLFVPMTGSPRIAVGEQSAEDLEITIQDFLLNN